jgi:hypothetical protein
LNVETSRSNIQYPASNICVIRALVLVFVMPVGGPITGNVER